mmetsp:Transcript_17878/g.49997  ORF Transcript_17878/g.49997 Transcript_17878/m.49997 type:complete len:102 (+) Transcript_17878:838-1143(+)|eukprot:596850-Pelagomonas_calceolata.AAC.1
MHLATELTRDKPLKDHEKNGNEKKKTRTKAQECAVLRTRENTMLRQGFLDQMPGGYGSLLSAIMLKPMASPNTLEWRGSSKSCAWVFFMRIGGCALRQQSP